MKKLTKSALIGLLALTCAPASQGKKFNSNFNNGYGFFVSRVNLNFPNEKSGMDVLYQAKRISRNGGAVALQAKRLSNKNGSRAQGSWLQTQSLFPNGSSAVAIGRTITSKGQAKDTFNWGGFWTLFDTARETGKGYNYYENDVMETYNLGQFANRYTFKNPKTNQLVIKAGEFHQFTGNKVIANRRQWKNHKVSWNNKQTVINSGGVVKKTIKGIKRGGNHRLILQNRPWPNTIGKVKVNQFLSSFAFDSCNATTP